MRNVVEYQVRKTFPPVLIYRDPPPPGSLAGVIRDDAGNPLPGAVALVSTVRGQVYQSRSDAQGLYRIDGLPPGRYVPMAGAWGYDAINGSQVQVRPGQSQTGIDFVAAPSSATAGRAGRPDHRSAARRKLAVPRADGRYPDPLYVHPGRGDHRQRANLPPCQSAGSVPPGGFPLSDQAPTLVIIYPSHPLNWNAASVALTRNGNPVLALGPHTSGGLDIDQHARNFRAALQLWQSGQLTPLGQPDDTWVAMSGSFGSLILFKALADLPAPPTAIVDVGGISDAFLGIQALYDADLAIPPPYDSAVAALGRPDRDPAFFYGFSPVFNADKLPPIFVIHTTNDEVIPSNQAEALDRALTAAGVPHELLLYEDTTHYLDAYHPTPGTHLVYERVLQYVAGAAQAAP